MEITFTCCNHDTNPPQKWEGHIYPIDPLFGEMRVTARGSAFHIFYGRYINGYYLCIPNINVGTDLANPSDVFWNREHLSACFPKLSKIDIISITEALATANEYLNI